MERATRREPAARGGTRGQNSRIGGRAERVLYFNLPRFSMSQTERQHRFLTILCFGLVYVFWGSTYLGIDIAIEHIPPALMCATRFLIAGVLLLVYCWLTGQTVRYGRHRLLQLAVIGILLLVGGNLTLSYAELYVPTGLAALLIAVTPLWFLVLDRFLVGDHRISRWGLGGLGLGVLGTLVLLWPQLTVSTALDRKELWLSIALLRRVAQLGTWFGALEALACRSSFSRGNRMAGDLRGTGQSSDRLVSS